VYFLNSRRFVCFDVRASVTESTGFGSRLSCSFLRQCIGISKDHIYKRLISVISGFRRDADEICALLECYGASNGNPLPSFRDNVWVPSARVKKFKKNTLLFLNFCTLEDRTDMLSRNVGKGLPFDAA
jgi:hypothetical protein